VLWQKLRQRGAILAVQAPGRFTLGHAAKLERVTFEARHIEGAPEPFEVREIARSPGGAPRRAAAPEESARVRGYNALAARVRDDSARRRDHTLVDSIFERAEWRRATRLAERLASLRARGRSGAQVVELERAQRELDHWRTQPPFDRGTLFERRLAHDGLGKAELLEVLGEPLESLCARLDRPAWLARIEHAYARAPRPLAEALPLPAGAGADPNLAFLDALEPLITQGFDELQRRSAVIVAENHGAPFDAVSAGALFLPMLVAGLERLSVPVFALELGIARLQGELEGATSRERFAAFVARLRRRDVALELLCAQPVLARRAVETIERWRDASAEFLARLAQDREVLARTFGRRADLGRLVRVQGGAGDAHRGGRSVVIATFEPALRLVYKPRSLAVDAHFQELVECVNAAGQEPALARIALVDRGTHGWVEFVADYSCRTLEEARAFYQRQGAWLALLHALGATDLHYENLIAAGDQPVPIDLETLLHGHPDQVHVAERAQRLAREALQRSVLRVGLLPSRLRSAVEDDPGADLSGLSGRGGQLTPDELLAWEGEGTDEMQATRRRAPLPEARNRPVLDGVPVPAEEHVEEIVHGFRGMWRLLAERRDDLLAPGGALARFAGDEVRSVVRATRFYGLLLEESLHPDFQGDALELERHFDRLWIGVEELPHLERTLDSERHDLLAGDVPVFTSRPGSRDLVDARGRTLEGYWRESGLELVARRLRSLDEAELERQEWLVRGSIATASVSADDQRWPSYAPVVPERAPAEAELRARALERALAIGERLEELALRDSEGHAAWLGFVFVGPRWELSALPDDLYAGAPGVALFLAHLARITGEDRFDALARAGIADLRANLRRAERMQSIGAFNGLGGLLYALAHLGHLWRDGGLVEQAGELAALAAQRIDADQDLDVVGGSAGLLVALESLRALDPRPRWDDVMTACAGRLRAGAERLSTGVGWKTRIGGPEPATGFSHGAAGIVWALLRLHRRSGASELLALAREGMRFENTLFDRGERNWLDPGSRRSGGDPSAGAATTMTAWCYGAPGIGLARLAALSADPGGEARRDVERAVAATRASGFGKNHCLCHGALGNLDFLFQAAGALGDAGLAEEFRCQAAAALASLARDGRLCGMPMGIESPSLMNGLAGIGLGCLRIARPDEVPSVLTLEVPR
jgi:type 2 lantibiotic biosynthesis protein LanM